MDKIFLQRETNRRLDTLGIDAVMASKSKIDYVDLKHHAFFSIEERSPDYALELETGWRDSSDKERHCGWFVNPDKVTDVSGFLFWNGTPDNIENMRMRLIRRQDIKNKLKSLGIDVEHWNEYTNNQLGRRNLSEIQRTILIGRRYDAEKKAHGAVDGFRGNQHSVVSPQIEDLPQTKNKTAEKMAEEMGISKSSIERAASFVKGLDAAEEVLPGIEQEIISGAITPTKQEVIAISKQRLELYVGKCIVTISKIHFH